MSSEPVDKRRASKEKLPWYINPATYKVAALMLRVAQELIDLFS